MSQIPEGMSSEFLGADLVGTVSTMYNDRNSPRFELAVDTAERYRIAGYPLVVVDSSGPENAWVAQELTRQEAYVIDAVDGGGIARQRMQGVAFAIANQAGKVIGHEPEKNLMIEFASDISEGLDRHDVLVIGRTRAAEDSLPPVQQRTERLAGWTLERTLALPPDALSGGRGFTVAGAEVLSHYPVDEDKMNNWIYLYDTPLRARDERLSVGGVAIDLIHPESMVVEENGDPVFDAKRYMQFNLQLSYLLTVEEVSPEYESLAELVTSMLKDLPEKATPDDIPAYERAFDALEVAAALKGYVPASRLSQ